MLKDYCITSDDNFDLFVGLRFQNGRPVVIFPHGYNISTNDNECRKDIFRLLTVLQQFTEHREGNSISGTKNELSSIPLMSYQYIIQDFLSNGYYTEKEIKYVCKPRGKINWKRTIQEEQPQLDGHNVIYLTFQTKTNKYNNENILTQIHRYCVYQSFLRFGWLFFSEKYLPEKPFIHFNKILFVTELQSAISNTFNDKKRNLFQSMLNIITKQPDEIDINHWTLGVNRFDHVWESLIDFVFGDSDKEKYFPHSTWYIIKNGRLEKSSALEPDTIMKYNNKIFVLDAKYYKYGITENVNDLPATSSIQKQITYGKHIANQFVNIANNNIYNAFIIPFNACGKERIKFVSVGTADWENYNNRTENYAYVLGILLDTRWIISNYVKHNEKGIESLSLLIEKSLYEYRQKN